MSVKWHSETPEVEPSRVAAPTALWVFNAHFTASEPADSRVPGERHISPAETPPSRRRVASVCPVSSCSAGRPPTPPVLQDGAVVGFLQHLRSEEAACSSSSEAAVWESTALDIDFRQRWNQSRSPFISHVFREVRVCLYSDSGDLHPHE